MEKTIFELILKNPSRIFSNSWLMLSLIITLFLLLNSLLFLKDPLIWPDEAIWADIAGNIIKENRMGTDLLKGIFPGIENQALWYPYLFFNTIAVWFKLFGTSIAGQRLISIVFGGFFLVFFYLFSKSFINQNENLNKSNWVPALATIALVIDFTFLRSTRISRPEIFILFWGILALYLFRKFLENISHRKLSFLLVAGSGLCSLAVLYHLMGVFFFISLVVYMLFAEKLKIFKSRFFYLFNLSFIFPVAIWIFSILPNFDTFWAQFFLVNIRKDLEITWILDVFQNRQLELKLIYLGYILMTLIFMITAPAIFNRVKYYLFLFSILSVSWFFVIYGKQFWYASYPLPFIYLTISILLVRLLDKQIWRKPSGLQTLFLLLISIFTFTILLNLKLQTELIINNWGDKNSYEKFGDNILKIIPENKTIFLSSIPDPYFIFMSRKRNNILYEFPFVKIDKRNYLNILKTSDYIIYTGSYENTIFQDFLPRYISKNSQKIYKIGGESQYRAIIIELKLAKDRVDLE